MTRDDRHSRRHLGCLGLFSSNICHILKLEQIQFVSVPVVVGQILEIVLPTEFHNQISGLVQIATWHCGEEMVLNLVVESSPEPVGEDTRSHVPGCQNLQSCEVVQNA